MTTASPTPDATAVHELRGQLEGTLATPADAGYDALRASWNLTFEQRPALVVEAADGDDVVAALGFAHEQQLPVAVQSTGHGTGVACDGGLLLRTGRLTQVEVDPVLRIARIGAGARWTDVLPLTAAHGLAPLLGFNPHVGVVGYTLGGGLGWLARRHGLAVDSVRALDVVLPDATHLRVTAAAEPDLFWALRGGASAFGVVVALELELIETPELFGGMVLYPGARAAEAIAAYADWAATAPEEVTSSVAVVRFPPLPEVPEPLRGLTAVSIAACVQRDAAAAEALLAPLRTLGAPLAGSFRPLLPEDLGTIAMDPVDPMPAAGHAEVVATLTPELQALLAETAEGERPLVIAELRHLGGALARAGADAGPIPRPAGEFLFHAETVVPPGPAGAAAHAELARLAQALAPHVAGPPLPSFLGELETGPERLEQAFPAATRARLGRLKARYDPDERFRFGRPVPRGWAG
ncbi:FAD-binding oxidoreductase [Conexibacter sp. JD483]|uniref:FAD-binding oxidoreductase n=1 Tax=unclassified Conexibacter TaxID=2627773 RepID=UPI0027164876|nr:MULTISPECIES: FAD-binding oxidoreductase [unclassified Conexibacter]MDO8189501.1 FAD-binding oxidoreductase [Conexibacter sp. CPCC 205706]MDO8198171.1 FAD-binding oxidoreductase [Conexibacter sp. CPCC 205762]MDR9372774.1 FAD-binding oxidoreductase [Conexibacter sp. JD483]